MNQLQRCRVYSIRGALLAWMNFKEWECWALWRGRGSSKKIKSCRESPSVMIGWWNRQLKDGNTRYFLAGYISAREGEWRERLRKCRWKDSSKQSSKSLEIPPLSSALGSLFHQENRIRNYCRARVSWYWLGCKNKCSCSCKGPFVPLFLY